MQVAVLRECAAQRTGDAATLLVATERAALEAALELDDPTLRACACMRAAAGIGDAAQARFWRKLPATLAAHVHRVADGDVGGASPMRTQGLRRRAAALGTERALYAADAIVREATQRLQWHERAHGGSFGEGEGGQEDAEARTPSSLISDSLWPRQGRLFMDCTAGSLFITQGGVCRRLGCTIAAY